MPSFWTLRLLVILCGPLGIAVRVFSPAACLGKAQTAKAAVYITAPRFAFNPNRESQIIFTIAGVSSISSVRFHPPDSAGRRV